MSSYHVYGLGAALVDTEIEVSDEDLQTLAINKGLMTLVDESRQQQLLSYLARHMTASRLASGGSAANTIIAVSSFGGSAYYSCQVANDENGRFYLDDLKRAGVHHNGREHSIAGTTGKCLVLITPDAERTMNTFLGVSERLGEANLDPVAIADSEYIYIEGYLVTSDPSRAAAIRARKIAEQSGVKTALSLSDPGLVAHFRDGFKAMIGKQVDLLFCNEAEALGWSASANIHLAAENLTHIARTFAITLGARGALVYDGSELREIRSRSVSAVDTNGAGDMFAGAFLYGITHSMSYEQAGRFACMAAASVVSQYGPRLPYSQHQGLLEVFNRA